MSRAAGRDRREPRVPGGLRHLPGVGSEQVVRPELGGVAQVGGPLAREVHHEGAVGVVDLARPALLRSEERRVGKECRSRWSPYH